LNYLAHAYLSFDHDETVVGNLISNFVKGNKRFDYPPGIQKGITLHRQIDRFTDEHDATRAAKKVFHADYRLYSGAFVDVVYDHFLANDASIFSETSLLEFAGKTYKVLEQHRASLPERFALMFPYMKDQNWLYNYRSVWGTEKSFGGIVRRALYISESAKAASAFERNYSFLEDRYKEFFPELMIFARRMFDELIGEK